MKIWTLTLNDDYGVRTHVFNTKEGAEGHAREWCRGHWREADPMPDDWRQVYEGYCDSPGFIDSLLLEEHDVSSPSATRMKISVCPYMNGDFEVMIIDPETGHEVMLSGNQELSSEELDTLTKLAPACVWTTYSTEQPNGHV